MVDSGITGASNAMPPSQVTWICFIAVGVGVIFGLSGVRHASAVHWSAADV